MNPHSYIIIGSAMVEELVRRMQQRTKDSNPTEIVACLLASSIIKGS